MRIYSRVPTPRGQDRDIPAVATAQLACSTPSRGESPVAAPCAPLLLSSTTLVRSPCCRHYRYPAPLYSRAAHFLQDRCPHFPPHERPAQVLLRKQDGSALPGSVEVTTSALKSDSLKVPGLPSFASGLQSGMTASRDRDTLSPGPFKRDDTPGRGRPRFHGHAPLPGPPKRSAGQLQRGWGACSQPGA